MATTCTSKDSRRDRRSDVSFEFGSSHSGRRFISQYRINGADNNIVMKAKTTKDVPELINNFKVG